jgi:hypothetical protein
MGLFSKQTLLGCLVCKKSSSSGTASPIFFVAWKEGLKWLSDQPPSPHTLTPNPPPPRPCKTSELLQAATKAGWSKWGISEHLWSFQGWGPLLADRQTDRQTDRPQFFFFGYSPVPQNIQVGEICFQSFGTELYFHVNVNLWSPRFPHTWAFLGPQPLHFTWSCARSPSTCWHMVMPGWAHMSPLTTPLHTCVLRMEKFLNLFMSYSVDFQNIT